MSTTPLIAAAQYLRMSTEHQQYSIQNQTDLIRTYADAHGFDILHTYSDAAKSGLLFKNRAGLRQLLQDVVNKPSFKVILVYDVSRWGRFQDTDESAHYEFICKSAGVPVHYCAEQFLNDGSFPSLIMKSLKRMMASEFSRELSVKVYQGAKHVSQLGFRVGGTPGYGLRRMLVSVDHQQKQELVYGQRKNIKEDRVILVPGPIEEVECVREIFRMYTEEDMRPVDIARELNRRGVKYTGPRRTHWYPGVVSRMLQDQKYIGHNVYGKRSHKLRALRITVPKALWIVTPNAWTPVVDEKTFEKAKTKTQSQTFWKSDEQLLDDLRGLLASKGFLNEKLLKSLHFPSLKTYEGRFGSLSEALARIEYKGGRIARVMSRRKRTVLRDELIHGILSASNNQVTLLRCHGRDRPRLRLRNRTLVSVCLCPSVKIKNGELRWMLARGRRELDQITLVARLNAANDDIQDFYLFPKFRRMPRTTWLNDERLRAGEPLASLSSFADTVQMVKKRSPRMRLWPRVRRG
jgi:DNA invertase Pin-like site-specific DNA recombinase